MGSIVLMRESDMRVRPPSLVGRENSVLSVSLGGEWPVKDGNSFCLMVISSASNR